MTVADVGVWGWGWLGAISGGSDLPFSSAEQSIMADGGEIRQSGSAILQMLPAGAWDASQCPAS
jgi:hypothetical protein